MRPLRITMTGGVLIPPSERVDQVEVADLLEDSVDDLDNHEGTPDAAEDPVEDAVEKPS